MSSAWAVLLWEINFVLRGKHREHCFCAGPGIWNIPGPPKSTGISYHAGWVGVRIHPCLSLPGTRRAWGSQPCQHPTLPASHPGDFCPLLPELRGHSWSYAGTSLIQQKLLQQQSWDILCQEIFCCSFLFPLFCGEISCLLTCFGMRKWKMIVSMNRLT